MAFFSMVTTRNSAAYTPVALASFFSHTEWRADDVFLLIDNDSTFDQSLVDPFPQVQVLRRESPCSFAANANEARARAALLGQDLFLLNNDVVFSEGWRESLEQVDCCCIASSISNQHISCELERLVLRNSMDLHEYQGKEALFDALVRVHRSVPLGVQAEPAVAFFCVRIPCLVYTVVGVFDESFGRGGAEDTDYCLRSWIAGFPVVLALSSFVLHFQGKSTWDGAESIEERSIREQRYVAAFIAKWGEELSRLLFLQDYASLEHSTELQALVEEQRYMRLLRQLSGSKLTTIQPRTAAVCCVHDDTRWLREVVRSVYDGVDAIYFIVSDKPWNGRVASALNMRKVIKELPDPSDKIRIVEGSWDTEAAQRNAGLAALSENGFFYCLVLDADEVFDPSSLNSLLELAAEKPYIDAWYISMRTYWKSPYFRIEPPESYKPASLIRVNRSLFTSGRKVDVLQGEEVPESKCIMHHLSYARSDEEVQRKLETFSHSHEIVPGWFERVWKGWDLNHELKNLHPCWPAAYYSAVQLKEEDVPEMLRTVSTVKLD
jgi:GT2 family glycosyltransferase